ncbi:MAG: gliding motility-associated C-terminal domain-containing protein, partial [Bacteroidales bacterium]
LKLVFTDKATGQGTIDWYGQAQESYFVKSTTDTLPAAFTTGTVRISSPPSITGLSDVTLCEGEELLTFAMVQGSNPISERYWVHPDGSAHTGPGLIFFSLEPGQSGTYTFVATDDRGCSAEQSMNLTVIPTPQSALPHGDTLLLNPGENLDAGGGFITYQWNTGETHQVITPEQEGWYGVTITTTNDCHATDSVYVTFREDSLIEPSQYFYIPNAFTPDGDGKNDVFMAFPNDNDISHFSMQVFDRWGGRIFESDDISIGWDGKKNGKPCPVGVYVYRLMFRVEGVPGVEGEQVLAGTVALVR